MPRDTPDASRPCRVETEENVTIKTSVVAAAGFVVAAMALTAPIRASIPGSTLVIPGSKTVLWVFAHPDDETLAAAGAIHEHEEAGKRNIVIVVDGGAGTWVCNDMGLSDLGCVVARRYESRVAIASLGVVPSDIHHWGWMYDDPSGWNRYDVEAALDDFITNHLGLGPGQVSLKGHSPNDHYEDHPNGSPAHREIGRALQNMNTRSLNRFTDVRYYRIGHLYGAFTCGTPGEGRARYLSNHWHAVKKVAMSEYQQTSWYAGRYGIAGRSVAGLWSMVANPNTPECWERPEDL